EGVVELAQGADPGGHHPAHVEAEDDVLAVLTLVNRRDWPVAAGGRLPAHVPVVVIRGIVAIVAKLPTGPPQPAGPVAAGPGGGRPRAPWAGHLERFGETCPPPPGGVGRSRPARPGEPGAATGAVPKAELPRSVGSSR